MSINYTQLLLFEEPLDLKVKNELKKLKESNDKSRKCQFAKIGEVRKRCNDLEERLAIIEKGLCSSTLQIVSQCDMVQKEPKVIKYENSNFSSLGVNPLVRMHLFGQPCAY